MLSLACSELTDGAIRDFNLVYRQSAYQARLAWLNLRSSKVFASQAGQIIIYAVEAMKINCPAFSVPLDVGQTLRIVNDKSELRTFTLSGDAFCCLIELSAVRK